VFVSPLAAEARLFVSYVVYHVEEILLSVGTIA